MILLTLANSLYQFGSKPENTNKQPETKFGVRILNTGKLSNNPKDKQAADLVTLAHNIHKLATEKVEDVDANEAASAGRFQLRTAVTTNAISNVTGNAKYQKFIQYYQSIENIFIRFEKSQVLSGIFSTTIQLKSRIQLKKDNIDQKINSSFFKTVMKWYYGTKLTRYTNALRKLDDSIEQLKVDYENINKGLAQELATEMETLKKYLPILKDKIPEVLKILKFPEGLEVPKLKEQLWKDNNNSPAGQHICEQVLKNHTTSFRTTSRRKINMVLVKALHSLYPEKTENINMLNDYLNKAGNPEGILLTYEDIKPLLEGGDIPSSVPAKLAIDTLFKQAAIQTDKNDLKKVRSYLMKKFSKNPNLSKHEKIQLFNTAIGSILAKNYPKKREHLSREIAPYLGENTEKLIDNVEFQKINNLLKKSCENLSRTDYINYIKLIPKSKIRTKLLNKLKEFKKANYRSAESRNNHFNAALLGFIKEIYPSFQNQMAPILLQHDKNLITPKEFLSYQKLARNIQNEPTKAPDTSIGDNEFSDDYVEAFLFV